MLSVKNISVYSSTTTSKGVPVGAPNESHDDFQVTSISNTLPPSAGRGISAQGYPSLGNLTLLALLQQTQDISQTPTHSRGGGGHVGAVKLNAGVEGEESSNSIEAQQLTQRKKLAKKMDVAEMTHDIDENDEINKNSNQEDPPKHDKRNRNQNS